MQQDKTLVQGDRSYRNWLSILDEFDVQFMVLDTQRDTSLFQTLLSQPGWTIDLRVGKRVLMARAQMPSGTGALT